MEAHDEIAPAGVRRFASPCRAMYSDAMVFATSAASARSSDWKRTTTTRDPSTR